jgi:methanogenic corrinoid protein MtbC1
MQKIILSTVDVARLFNVTETTVKRWADEGTLCCQKTPGGHRKFPMRNIIEFAEQNNFEPVGVLSLPEGSGRNTTVQTAILSRDFSSLAKAFVDRALSPDRTDLYLFFSYLYEHRFPLWEIYDKVLRPGMQEIGGMWERGEIGVNQEHRASYETMDALARLQAEIFVKPATGKSVIFACMGEELHEIGLRSAAYVFEAEGWTTHYIGARTPVASVVEAVKDLRPSVLALSVTYPEETGQIVDDLRSLAEQAHRLGVPIILGGTGIPPQVRELSGVDAILTSSRDILDFTARLSTAESESTRRMA